MQRQPVPERAEVCTVDGNFVLRRFSQYQQIEAFAVPDRAATVAFLRPDHLVLDRVARDRVLVRSNANVQGDIVARIHCRTRLNVDLAAGVGEK